MPGRAAATERVSVCRETAVNSVMMPVNAPKIDADVNARVMLDCMRRRCNRPAKAGAGAFGLGRA
jgi:hypothetical protein